MGASARRESENRSMRIILLSKIQSLLFEAELLTPRIARSPAEEKVLRRAIAERYPHRMPDFLIALGTGMRLSERFGLTWDEIDVPPAPSRRAIRPGSGRVAYRRIYG